MTDQKARTWTPEETRRYWKGQRDAYKAKNERLFMEPGFTYCPPRDFYRFLFGDGFLEERGVQVDWDEPGGGKPNAIAIVITHQSKGDARPVARHHAFHDGFDDMDDFVSESLSRNETAIMAPVSYFGRRRDARHAQYLHALTFDLDGVGTEQLGNLLKQTRNGHDPAMPKWTSMPQPSAIVNSGQGLHLYYVLERPVPLVPKVIPFLQKLKQQLTKVIWTEYTSSIPRDQMQFQGIYQGFRMVGTTTKLNGPGEGDKRRDPYEATCFRYSDGGRPWRVPVDYLVGYAGLERGGGSEGVELLRDLLATGGRTPLERARKLWPDWYSRRVVNGAPAGRWTAHRALYDWWLETIRRGATYHHRYYCLQALATYANKAGVPFDELERDAYSLVPFLDELTEEPSNHFTESDAAAAIEAYHDGLAHRSTRGYIELKTAIQIPANKRNGRKQEVHLAGARAVQEVNDKFNGTNWRDGNGRKPKCDLIRSYAVEHPNESNVAISRALGVSRTTVVKWLRPGWRDEWDAAHGPAEAGRATALPERLTATEGHGIGQPYPNGRGGFSVDLWPILGMDDGSGNV